MFRHTINNWNFVRGFQGTELLDMDSEGKKLVNMLRWRCELGVSYLHLCLNNYINVIIAKHHFSQ